MARPPGIEKRREICANAIEFLENNGIDTSTSALAEGIGLKRPTLLYYYPDRKELLQEALFDLIAEQVAFVLRRIATHSHPVDQLFEQMRSVHLFHHRRERRLLFLTQGLALAGSDDVDGYLRRGEQAFSAERQALARRIENGIREGSVHPCDPKSLVLSTRALVDGFMIQRVVSEVDLEPIHQFLWEHLFLPLKVLPPPEQQSEQETGASRAMPTCNLQPERNQP